jgi:hypothetical protein
MSIQATSKYFIALSDPECRLQNTTEAEVVANHHSYPESSDW